MKTLAEIIHNKTYPLEIFDSNGYELYYEGINGRWAKFQYNSNNNRIYYEDFRGYIVDNRP